MQRTQDNPIASGVPKVGWHILGDLDLGGVDAQIAAQLARIAEQARNDDASGNKAHLSALQAELDRVIEHMAPGSRSRSPVALLALGTVAVASVVLALVVSPGEGAGTARAYAVAVKPAAATAPAAVLPAKRDPGEETRAKRARDSALAARFRSVKAEATTYNPDLHLTAQRKELEADAAFHRGKYGPAIAAYDMAREGYRLAAERAEFTSASMDKARIDAQVAIDAQSRRTPQPVGYDSSRTSPQDSPGGVIRPLILYPPAAPDIARSSDR